MATILPVSTILLVTGFGLALIGLWGILMHRNLLRIIIGFALIDTGLHIVMVATGYVTGGTAPIIDAALGKAEAAACDRPDPFRVGRDGHRHRLRRDGHHARLCGPPPRGQEDALDIVRLHGVEMVASLFHPLNIFRSWAGRRLRHSAALPARHCVAYSRVLHRARRDCGHQRRFAASAFSAASPPSIVLTAGIAAACLDQSALWPVGRILRLQRQCRGAPGRAASLGSAARQLRGAAALSDPHHGHQRHGDDPRPLQSLRLPGDRLHRDLWPSRAGANAGRVGGGIQVHHGDGHRLVVLPARHGAALLCHRHAQHR